MRIGLRNPTTTSRGAVTGEKVDGGPVIDEQTTPGGRPAPPPTQEQPAATAVTQESKAAAQARFKNDPRARFVEHTLRSGEADVDRSSATGAGKVPAPPAVTYKTVADAKAAIEKKYGVTIDTSGKPWTAEELTRVDGAWSKMSATDREALRGLTVKRAAEAPDDLQAAEGTDVVAGVYNGNVETTNGTRDQSASITYFDAAFPPGNGDASRRTSEHVILHEAGHAVEGRKLDEAVAAHNAAVDDEQQPSRDLDHALKAMRESFYDVDHARRGLSRAQQGEVNDFYRAQRDVDAASHKIKGAKDAAALAKANAQMDSALARLDKAAAGVSSDNPAAAAIATSAQAVRGYGAAWVAYGGPALDERTTQKTQNALGKAHKVRVDGKTVTRFTSNELASFERGTRGDKAVSAYGATAPAENYAEAHALYRRDPAYLKKHFPKTYAWFAKHHP